MKIIFLAELCILGIVGNLLAESEIALIPAPVKMARQEGEWKWQQQTTIKAEGAALPVAQHFARSLAPAFGWTPTVKKQGEVVLSIDSHCKLPKEGYKLKVSQSGIRLTATTPEGLYRGTQTIRQLLPPVVFSQTAQKDTTWNVPCVEISDYPRFPWRGLMLDVSRHFFTKEEVMRYIDVMAAYKFNVFHWHLVDSHGWRLEIKKYPMLTQIGAWRMQPDYPEKGKKERYGGFYTQDEIREVVAYAAERFITIVPEIEMPGHSSEVVASYPELSCLGGQGTYNVAWFYSYPCPYQKFPYNGCDVLCAGKEMTFYFLEDVLRETMELFPSEYIHIGGDEVNKQDWANCKMCKRRMEQEHLKNLNELQSYFIRRIEKFLHAHGRKLIGWDEILAGGLPERAAVMSWRGIAGGIAAAKQRKKVVMSPEQSLYLDRGQSKSPFHPNHWPGYVPLETTYAFDPIPKPIRDHGFSDYVMGVQGNLWSAFVHTRHIIDVQTWPRACAIAELGWTPERPKSFDEFHSRLNHIKLALSARGVEFWDEDAIGKPFAHWDPSISLPIKYAPWKYDITKQIRAGNKGIVYFLYRSGLHALQIRSVSLLKNGKVVSTDAHEGLTGSEHRKNNYAFSLPKTIEPNAKYEILAEVEVLNSTPDGKHQKPDSTGDIYFFVQ